MKILLIEDEKDLVKALKKGFIFKGFDIDVAYDGKDGLDKYFDNHYEVIILDLNIPIIDGLQVLKEIRKVDKQQKIIILSAKSEIADKVLGFELGTNDYLAKPFDFLELLARVQSLCLRTIIQNSAIISIGNLCIDTNLKSVYVGKEMIKLSVKEYRILEYLILNKNIVLSGEKILDNVWSNECDMISDTLKVHISNLRKKIPISSKVIIKSRRGEGYILEDLK